MKRIDELFKPLILILSLIVFVWYALTTRYEYYVVPGVPNGNNNTSTNRGNVGRYQDTNLSYVVEVDAWTNKMIKAGEELRRRSFSRPSASTRLHEGEAEKSSRNKVRPDYGGLNPDTQEEPGDLALEEYIGYLDKISDPNADFNYDPKQVARAYAIFDSARKAAEQEQAQTRGSKP